MNVCDRHALIELKTAVKLAMRFVNDPAYQATRTKLPIWHVGHNVLVSVYASVVSSRQDTYACHSCRVEVGAVE